MVSLSLEDASTAVTYFGIDARSDRIYPPIRLWAIGDEQDLLPTTGTDQNNAYTYLNQFRPIANAIKALNPNVLLWGPETGADSPQGDSDWITPLLKYDGDVVNGVSFHRYGWGQAVTLSAKTIQDNLRHEIDTLVGLGDRVSENSDINLPFAITGGQALKVPSAGQTLSPENRMLPAIWEADQRGQFFKGGLSMFLSGPGVWSDPQGPSYWALQLWSQMKRGKILNAGSQEFRISVYSTQDPQTKDVTLMLINKSERFWKPKIRLDGQDEQISVEAGLDLRYDFECSAFSVCLLEIHADRSPGQAWVLDPDSLKKGEPRMVPLKPW
jgi:hypothetical protein